MAKIALTAFGAALAFGATSPRLPHPAASAARSTSEQIAINDNRTPAGTLANGILTIRLEARVGEWHPDADSDPAIAVEAFAEEGKPLQIPGPAIRVVEGTEIRAFVRNAMGNDTLTVHGLYSRGAARSTMADTIQVRPNEVRNVRFVADAPGTYYYWGAPNANPQLNQRRSRSTQLSGAIIVDPRGANPRPDRVFVMSLWGDSTAGAGGSTRAFRIVMNGKSWPHTERVSYQVGDTVRLRIINAGAAVHPMHLHGFYFNVDSRGAEARDSIYAASSSPRLVVTERLTPGRTFSLTWTPTRAGNWLFHCHDNVHIARVRPLDGSVTTPDHHVENHALEMMSGPVIGFQVTSREARTQVSESGARRQLRLVARVDSGGSDREPSYGYTLEDKGKNAPLSRPYLPGPTIVLKRDEPVSITVVNELPEPTAVHWHGIELDSYFDGVAGFSGSSGRISPAIAPRDSFAARFTPPRSGTFIYHTHVDEVRQQRAGLSGALLIVDDPATYDPATDLVMLVTVPRALAQNAVVLLNGTSTPDTLEMKVGSRYRLRWINVHTFRPSMIMKVMRDSSLMTWRPLAKDGMPLPTDQSTQRPSAVQMGNGETYDFEFQPSVAEDIRIEVTAANGTVLVRRPIRVR
ncbi:MAG TPA: multicopper oxidase domain-containing protein [Gemmatimonadaceae bacterium]|nr:multicopper oxidase domain-containing protein [Gemmatimonadaceae bacterium]